MKNQNNIYLWTIFIIALVFRVVGTSHGFPFIFHPDEPALVRSALEIRFFPNPGHFDWPHLYIYVNYVLFMAFAFIRTAFETLGHKAIISTYLPVIWNDELVFYLISRIFTAIIGALTIVPIYLAGKRLFGKSVGVLSALVFAIIPFHVYHSHYALIDIPMVFFVAWSLYFCAGILKNDANQDYAGAGLNVGLAASTKYNGGFTSILVFFAHVFRVVARKEKIISIDQLSKLFLSGVIAIIGFIIGTPYALLDYGTFLRTDGPKGALWQFKNVGSADSVLERFQNLFFNVFTKIADDLGYTFFIIIFIVLLYLILRAIFKRCTEEDPFVWWLLLAIFSILIYIAGFTRIRSHYLMIAYPYIALLVGWVLDHIYILLKEKLSVLGFFIMTSILFVPALMSFNFTYAFFNGDTRLEMLSWLKNQPNYVIVYADPQLTPVLDTLPNSKIKDFGLINTVSKGFVIVTETDFESEVTPNFASFGNRLME